MALELFVGSGTLVEKYRAAPAGDVHRLLPGERFQLPVPGDSLLSHYWLGTTPDDENRFWSLYQNPPLVIFLDQSCDFDQTIPPILLVSPSQHVALVILTSPELNVFRLVGIVNSYKERTQFWTTKQQKVKIYGCICGQYSSIGRPAVYSLYGHQEQLQ